MTERPLLFSAPMAGIEVRSAPTLLQRSYEVAILGGALLVWSLEAVRHRLRGVRWHDEPGHCPTWAGGEFSGGCRCDLGEGA